MPLLTRRRIAGLYLGTRLAGLAVLPAIVLVALPLRHEAMTGLPDLPTGGVKTLVSHAGNAMVWEGALSHLWLASEAGVRQVIESLAPAAT